MNTTHFIIARKKRKSKYLVIILSLILALITCMPLISQNRSASADVYANEMSLQETEISALSSFSDTTNKPYYITNFYANKHLQLDSDKQGGELLNSGVNVELWGFNDLLTQRWYINR